MAIAFLTQAQRDSIVELYIAYFNRAPEAAGLNSWSTVMMADLNAGKTATEALKGIANQFYAAGVQFGVYSAAQTVESFITTAYANALGRTSVDADGMKYWTTKLVSGEVSRGEFVQSLIKDAKAFAGDATWGWVSTYMANRVAVGNAFADNSAGLTGAAAITAGTTALSGVTAALAQAGQTAAQAVAAFTAPAAVVGQTFTLTASAETKTGTSGNDTFLALNNGDLGNSDIIDGGAGTDTLYAVVQTASTLRPVITSVENIELEVLNKTAGAAETFAANFDKSSGVTKVTVKNFNSDAADNDTVEVSGVTTATSLKITDDVGGATGGATDRANNFTMSYTGVTGATDAASVEISSTVTASALGAITVAGIEALTVSSTGGAGAGYKVVAADATTLTLNASAASGGAADVVAAKVATLNINAADSVTVTDSTAAAALRTVNINSQTAAKTVTLTTLTPTVSTTSETHTYNVTGAGKAIITFEDTDFGTQVTATNADTIVVNATGNTGGVSANLSSMTNAHAARTLSVTGGSGNDTVIVIKTALDKYDTVNLAGGTADRLSVAVTGNTNADVFYTDTTVTADLPVISGVEIASIAIGTATGAATLDVTSAKFAATIELTGTQATTTTLAVSGIAAGQKVALGSSTAQFLNGAATTLNVAGASTNTSDVLSITTDIVDSTGTGTLAAITAANVETVSVDLASSTTVNTTIAAGTLTFADATSVALTGSKITSATVVAKTGATIDATGVTGLLTLTASDDKVYTVKGSATAATTFVLGANLNNADSVTGGASATDSLTATVTGLDATTGALKISGVETLDLTNTVTAIVDLTGTTGVKTVSINGANETDDVATLKGLAAGTQVTLGNGSTAHVGTLTVALADATGAADSLTLNLTGLGTGDLTTLTTVGIETLNIVGGAAMDVQNISLLGVDAKKIVVTGGNTVAKDLELTGGSTAGTAGTVKLNANTSEVDASGYNGVISAIAATNTATKMSTSVAGSLLTGGALGDTFNVGSTASYVTGDVAIIDGGSGSDTLNVYVKNAADLDEITAVETINIFMDASDTDGFGMVGVTTADGIDIATTVTLNGGLKDQMYAISGSITDTGAKLIDARNLLGSTSLIFAEDAAIVTNAADMITIHGGQSATDQVTFEYDGAAAGKNSGQITMSGVERLVVQSHTTNANTLDMLNMTGVTTITVTDGTQAGTQLNVNNAVSGLKFIGGTSTADQEFTQVIDLNLTSTTSTSDVVTLELFKVTGTGSGIDATGIETVNLVATALATSTATITTSVLGTTTNGTINVSGVNANDEITLGTIAAGYTTVNAATLAGDLTIAASARGANAMTITGGLGSDAITMENTADVLDGGTKASDNDTLNISFSGTGGALIVDLSSSTDQVAMFNGLANSAVQKNFESVNASAYTQTNTVGADITGSTAANIIVGTAYADTIRTNGGGDTVTGGAGADTITLGAGVDTVVVGATDSLTASYDHVTGFALAGVDILDLITPTIATAVTVGVDVKAATVEASTTVTAILTAGRIILAGADAANVDTLAEWIAVAHTVGVVTNDTWATFQFSGNTYVVFDTAGAVTQVIELVGTTGVSLITTGTTTDAVFIA